MLEDVLYEILPVIGFALVASSVFVIIVMRKAVGAFRFTVWFATIDLAAGIATIYAGFYGIISTVYGKTGEMTTPFKCLSGALHVSGWLFLDVFHLALLSLFCFDRLLFMLIPVMYANVSRAYLNLPFVFVLGALSGALITPGFSLSIKSYHNESILVPTFCRLDSVTGDAYYRIHSKGMEFIPVGGIASMMLALVIFGIRSLKQRWLYNWSEDGKHSKQLYLSLFLRCSLTAISIHTPLLLMLSQQNGQLRELRDLLARMLLYTIVCVLQPLWYVLVMPEFISNTRMVFNQYGHSTERKWQSADDPPQDIYEHKDRFGDGNPFGSWYSSAGNVNGEAGIPTGNERSISFYYDRV
ncbi:hypothetical protein Q1695_006236 [Nippostrongylus brasiliensis]|nr:hypothetical protein Q1695_006236 [Nippostrongylus brasiliensis]